MPTCVKQPYPYKERKTHVHRAMFENIQKWSSGIESLLRVDIHSYWGYGSVVSYVTSDMWFYVTIKFGIPQFEFWPWYLFGPGYADILYPILVL